MKKGMLMLAILITAMALAIPSIASASSPHGLPASLLRAYTGAD
jgi:hypothetical protein